MQPVPPISILSSYLFAKSSQINLLLVKIALANIFSYSFPPSNYNYLVKTPLEVKNSIHYYTCSLNSISGAGLTPFFLSIADTAKITANAAIPPGTIALSPQGVLNP